jgi:uncharacterized protein (DUF1800 family)
MKRRKVIQLLGGAGIGVALAGCNDVKVALDPRGEKPDSTSDKTVPAEIVKLISRATFGALPGQLTEVARAGVMVWLDAQFDAPVGNMGESFGLQWRLRRLDALHETAYNQRDFGDEEVLRQIQQASLLRATYSKWQLRERMMDFWTTHFNVYSHKPLNSNTYAASIYLTFYQAELLEKTIRPNVLTTFDELLTGMMQSPAMLAYLDQNVSDAEHPNENYARELLELHTLGVKGGYTQRDVMEVARCLTGWTIEDRFMHRRGTLYFDETRHDTGKKVVLNQTVYIPKDGAAEAIRVREILIAHPACAKFIAGKMVAYFYGDGENAEKLTTQVAAVFGKRGDIKAMLKTLFTAPELATAPLVAKRPLDLLVSALRTTNAETDGGKELHEHLERMGQPLYQWPMPDGYPFGDSNGSGSLLPRWNFALALVNNQIKGTGLSHLEGDSAKETEALRLCAPDFQWR